MLKALIYFFALLFPFVSFGQDPNFSQFYNNPVYYNAAMTAINKGATYRTNVRNLWGPIPGRFNTFSASADAQSIYKMGFGANVYSDVGGEGFLRTVGGNLTYSYRLIDSKNFIIQLGVAGGFVSKSVDWGKLTFSDQLDETRGEVYTSQFVPSATDNYSYADFNSGIVFRFNGRKQRRSAFKQFTSTHGFSVHHLSQPKDAFLGSNAVVPMRLIYHGRIQLLFNDVIVAPGLIMEAQNNFRTFTGGIDFVQKPFTFGIWLRNRTIALTGRQFDSFIFTNRYEYSKI